MTPSRAAALLAGLLALATAGCATLTPKPPPYVPKYTYQQAAALNQQHILDTVKNLPHQPTRLEAFPRIGEVPCAGPFDDQPTGDVMLEGSYWLRGLDPADDPLVFDQVQRYWATINYHITLTQGPYPDDGARKIVARGPDDFNMILVQQGDTGALNLGYQSPCVHSLPRPTPTAMPTPTATSP